MTLQEKINADLKAAMLKKDKTSKSILRVLIGEIDRNPFDRIVSDEKVISIVKKMIENAKIVGSAEDEIAVLENYIPKQLTEEELGGIISSLIFENGYTAKDMGKIMSSLKSSYNGRYDGKVASTLIKNILSTPA